jgi:AraC-like DNA-binding protein
MGPASVVMATLAGDPPPMVAGGEALRLKVFLAQQQVRLPRSLHRIAQTPEDADDERVSERLLVRTLDVAMRTLRRPSLPIDFGSTIRARDMGIYGMAIQTAPTVADALARSVRFQRLMTTTGRIVLEREPGVLRWVWRCAGLRTLGVRVRNEVVLAEHVAVMRAITCDALPRRVSFMHAAPEDSTAHARFFGCAIEWQANEDSVEWAAPDTTRSLGVDAALGAFIEREAERRLALLPPGGSLDEVKDAILRRLPTGNAGLITVAALLGRTPRTLRRELASGGCTYRALVDGIRRQRAVEMASQGQHSMSEIALRLGFSEVSALSRAWKRWFTRPFSAMWR